MNIHFIAIGGSAMHNLALALHDKGHRISGSDDVIFEPSKTRLQKAGLLPDTFGWFPDKIHSGLDAVILGMHARADNPELARARELGVPIYSYPEFLYEQAKDKTRVVIGGSHGKTTITSMILHVLSYWDKPADYMVGAQLEGFDRMVHLTGENEFMVLEGDEYLSSAIDRRPKFHLYQPNIALLSGIAWDHINVFPTFENYLEQFRIFLEGIVPGGSITYNTEDPEVKALVEGLQAPIRKFPYATPDYEIRDGVTYLDTPEGMMPLKVFGRHNLNNMAGAQWICQQMGVDATEFYEAMATFKGAARRLELLAGNDSGYLFKDFAHSPSKAHATTRAVREQYPGKKLVACLELHTYSSLNADFLSDYRGSLDAADRALVFYTPEALKIKGLEEISPEDIQRAFNLQHLEVYTETAALREALEDLEVSDTVLLMMSSGNYGGLDLEALAGKFR
ncbi:MULTISPECIES: UDP-N-acetylmuramate--L-alanine ligase [Robiginitalea]|uniref:UDP-N-acetylmuramate--L-alanine ligase n=1 Tax=Robiginitalea TaxID=252306 RepID=UPI00234B49AF|nr:MULTISPECIES: Mur ligase domain-containing protein [unclassified Robiginitalea]MDC6355524.1 Mur ligase domain-containing protein [Robiginitalea sp. PM2]MDC6375866.1 Mur ligase domain-containing protein [Robiginitalea sp. SP8]